MKNKNFKKDDIQEPLDTAPQDDSSIAEKKLGDNQFIFDGVTYEIIANQFILDGQRLNPTAVLASEKLQQRLVDIITKDGNGMPIDEAKIKSSILRIIY